MIIMYYCLTQSQQLVQQPSPPDSIETQHCDRWDYSSTPQLTLWTSEEHILRSSTGFDAKSSRLRASSIVTNPYEEIATDGFSLHGNKSRYKLGKYSKYSPTPSIKRGKAEKLLKEHGSPPGVRVTAGGRIVPDGLSPTASPHFDIQSSFKHDYNNSLSSGFVCNSASTPIPKHLNGYLVEIGNGLLGQVVDGEVRSIGPHNGVLQLHVPHPNMSAHPGVVLTGQLPGSQAFVPFVPQPVAQAGLCTDISPLVAGLGASASHLPTEREVRVMEQVHSKLEHDLKDLDRHEVLQRAFLDQAKRAEIVRARVALINRIDTSRRAIENAKKWLNEELKIAGLSTGVSQSQQEPSGHTQSQRNATRNELHFVRNEPHVPSGSFELNLHSEPQLSYSGNKFQPSVPDFVPNSQYIILGQGEPRLSPVLPERAANIGLGLRVDLEGSCGSTETVKAFDVKNHSGSMNLDGSAHHSRRSHAIEIKKPYHESACGKSNLDPTSPSYRPNYKVSTNSEDTDGPGEVLNFVPSPSLVAQMDSLVQSPVHQDRVLDDSAVDTHQSSDSSATTADFFPQDAYRHSSRKLRPNVGDIQVNLPAWMPKDGEDILVEPQMTLSRPPTKFVFNDESPSKVSQPKFPASGESHGSSSRCRNQLECGSSCGPDCNDFCVCNGRDKIGISNTTPSMRDRSVPDAMSVSRPLARANEPTLPLSNSTTSGNDAYLQGFKTGIRQDILGNNKNMEYRIGYRDGLIQSSLVPSSAPILGCHVQDEHGSRATEYKLEYNSRGIDQLPAITKAISFPSFGGTTVSVPPVPMPPANSLATTPSKHWSDKQERSPITETSLDSPAARAEFMSQPNVNVNLMRSHSVVANPLQSLSTEPDRTSPLANRCSNSTFSDIGALKDSSFAARMKNRKVGYDQQRYQKSATSVAQTNDYARAQFPSRYDGSADDEHPHDNGPAQVQPEVRHSADEKARSNKPGSPVRIRASAAVATMRQAAGLGNRKEEESKREGYSISRKESKKHKETDPALMSSPEKRKWRQTWAKNFRQLKKEEQAEIEKYKQDHLIH